MSSRSGGTDLALEKVDDGELCHARQWHVDGNWWSAVGHHDQHVVAARTQLADDSVLSARDVDADSLGCELAGDGFERRLQRCSALAGNDRLTDTGLCSHGRDGAERNEARPTIARGDGNEVTANDGDAADDGSVVPRHHGEVCVPLRKVDERPDEGRILRRLLQETPCPNPRLRGLTRRGVGDPLTDVLELARRVSAHVVGKYAS